MADERVLADTSLFIEHLRARDKTKTSLYRLTRSAEVETCAIVAAEVFYGARNAASEQKAWSVLQPFTIHPFTVEMAARQCTVLPELVRRNRVPDIRDLMIAVTALEVDAPVATLNPSHFEAIVALAVVDAKADD